MPEVEDEVGEAVAGLPAMRGSAERTGTSRWSSGVRRRGSEIAMAVVELVGGDGYVRFRERERQRRGRAREWERGTGVARGVARRVEEEAARRRWPTRARARRAHALLPTGVR